MNAMGEGLAVKSRLDRGASLVSHLLNPAMVAWWVFGGLAWLVGGSWVAGIAGVAFYAVLPGLVLIFLYKIGFIEDVYPPERAQRACLLLLGAGCYFLGVVVLRIVEAPDFMLGAGWTYCGNSLLVWQINRYWKISIHAMVVSGGVLILLLAGGMWLWPLVLTLPLVAWARLQLKSHTPAQIVAGALLGGCSTGLLLSLLSAEFGLDIIK